MGNSLDNVINKLGPVVNDVDKYALRKRRFYVEQTFSKFIGNFLTIFSHEHESEAKNNLSFALKCYCSSANLVADNDLSNIGYADRGSPVGSDHNPFDV